MTSRRRGRPSGLVLTVAAVLLAASACSGGEDPRRDAVPAPTSRLTQPPSSQPTPSAGEPEGTPTEPTGMRVRSTFFGMHYGGVSQGMMPDAPIGSIRLWDAGTTWLQLEPSPGQFSWDPLDTAVETATAAGARPLLVLGQTPTFHASAPQQDAFYGPGAASMPDLAAWRRYVHAVAKRYGNRIDYQVWNEANVRGFWTGTPEQMATLTITAAKTIREVVPRATVVAPAFALRLPGQQNYFEKYWALQSPGFDLAGAVDVVSVQLYPPAEALPEAQAGLLAGARKVLDEHGIDEPVWNTEINYGLGGSEPSPISEELQRAFLMRTYLLNAGLGVERVYWYRWDLSQLANTYLVEEDLRTETLAGESFDVVRAWLGGTVVEECTRGEVHPGVWECTARKDSEQHTFWWKPRGPAIKLTAEGARSWTGADGKDTPCGDTCRVPVSASPILLTLHS